MPTRYTIKFDHQPRIKIDSRGYRSLSLAMGRADRAVLSGKCTSAEVLSATGVVLYTATRDRIQAMVAELTPDQLRYWKAG